MAMKAKDVTPFHVLLLLTPIWKRGSLRQAAKVRSYLVAALNYGLSAEHHIERTSQKIYGLTTNAASAVTVPNKSVPGKRALNDEELKQFWQTVTKVDSVGPVMARSFQFALATAGQRPLQFIREPWDSYDLKKKHLKIVDRKGRGSEPRVHLVPLTERALGILAEVRALQPEDSIYPWSIDGKRFIHPSSLSHAVAEWRETIHAKLGDKVIPKFTPRDIRRTCTQFMQRKGIKDFDSDALQSHGQTGVVGRHYRNDPEAKLPEMRLTMSAYDTALGLLLDGTGGDEVEVDSQAFLFEIG
jgi:integrase